MKKGLALFLSCAMGASLLAGCGGGTSDSSSAGDSQADSAAVSETGAGQDSAAASDASDGAASGTVYTIGICQQVEHDALDAATQGFQDACTECPGRAGQLCDNC